MSEERRRDRADDEPSREEVMRRLNHKQKLLEKVALRSTRTLTDEDIVALISRARVPGSALLGNASMASARNVSTQQPVSDEDPRDSILYSDFDMSPDPVTVTDMDPTDSPHHPFPA